MKLAITETSIREDANHIYNASGVYDREHYKQADPIEWEPLALVITKKIPLQLAGNDLGHRIIVPVLP
ncbi:hypothetical protein ACFSR7_35775 [Cohnella sp. GCM10020058]|uniref:hypothetical protein n=1 Tax=Cohnella sp. GCM10020058 TaxID=3317330 RepID=UPI003624D440